MGEEEDNVRPMPGSELDLNLMLTDSVWGRTDVISKELKDKLGRYFHERDPQGEALKDENGNYIITKSSLWGLLGFFTRDMRLANLSRMDNELEVCRYMINLAGDFLQIDMIEPFLISLSRAATIMETSQSKGGFLRKMSNTLIQKSSSESIEPQKKTLFGKGKGKGEY